MYMYERKPDINLYLTGWKHSPQNQIRASNSAKREQRSGSQTIPRPVRERDAVADATEQSADVHVRQGVQLQVQVSVSAAKLVTRTGLGWHLLFFWFPVFKYTDTWLISAFCCLYLLRFFLCHFNFTICVDIHFSGIILCIQFCIACTSFYCMSLKLSHTTYWCICFWDCFICCPRF